MVWSERSTHVWRHSPFATVAVVSHRYAWTALSLSPYCFLSRRFHAVLTLRFHEHLYVEFKKNQRFLLSSHSLLAPVLDALATERFIVTTFRKIQKRDVIKTNIYPSLTKKKKTKKKKKKTCCIYAAFNFLAVLAADTVQRPFDRSSGPKAENLVGACCCSLIISSGPRGRE